MTETGLCRLCAELKNTLIGIYEAEGQKLAIEKKILTYLQIEILTTDDLPTSVCQECWTLLVQYGDFHEKTKQAQTSLRTLLLTRQSEDQENSEPITEKDEKPINLLIPEEHIDIPENIIESGVDLNDTHYSDENNDSDAVKFEIEEAPESRKKQTSLAKKISPKQAKKKVKRRASRKLSNVDIPSASEDEDDPDYDTKSNVKIPDNYMTGTDSDKEIIETKIKSSQEVEKTGKKKGAILDRYPWLCTDCNDKLASLELLEQHHKTVHNQQAKYMCVQCCKVYDKYYGFLTHVRRHKNISTFKCEDCGKSFVHKKVLDSHRAIHSEERPHICQTCGKSFRQQSALYIHNRCHLPETMKNRFPCDQCGKRFSTKPNLVTHKRIHSGVRNFTCDQCGKSFIQKGNLEAHFLTHSADKPFNCSQCPKAFKTPLQLKKHETVHTGAKPHQCAVCGRTFREKGTLREHHRIHTGAMPFTCEYCGKSFRFKGILTTHRRQHTGERPYSCLECQHHFTNWPNYNKHMKRRHGINTSHNKHLQQPQAVESSQEQVATTIPQGPTPVQIIQAIPHSSTQSIVLQTIPATTVQTFPADVPVNVQDSVFRERNTTYFNAVPGTIQTFLPTGVPYNFYSVSENDLILPK